MNEHTRGEWTAKFDEHGGYDCMTSAYNIRTKTREYNPIATLDTANYPDAEGDHDRSPEADANARLICSAVNGCQAVSPDNPMATAMAIKEMYWALKCFVSTLTDYLEDVGEGKLPMGCVPSERLSQADKLARQALAKVEGK